MRFWDSSALVPLLVEDASSGKMKALLASDAEMTVWWGTPTECWSALARREREAGLPAASMEQALANLRAVMERAHEVLPCAAVRTHSRRLLFTHALRAADALQLAAAIVLAGSDFEGLEFVTLDEVLAQCARREGFKVVGG